VLANVIPRSILTAGQETERLALNALLAANWNASGDAYADAFVDISAAVDWTDNSYATYTQDGTHPNATGQAVIAAAMLAALQSLGYGASSIKAHPWMLKTRLQRSGR
jgi:lysophospholipase L1-like esterase